MNRIRSGAYSGTFVVGPGITDLSTRGTVQEVNVLRFDDTEVAKFNFWYYGACFARGGIPCVSDCPLLSPLVEVKATTCPEHLRRTWRCVCLPPLL